MASGETLVVFTALNNEPPSAAFATPDLRNGHPVLDFDPNTDEEAVFTGSLPARYGGGGLTCEIVWTMTSATSGAISVQAAIETMGLAGDDMDADSFAAFQAAQGTAAATSGVLFASTITFTSGAQMDSLAAGQMFRFKIRRDADGTVATDDATGDAEFHSVEIRET